MNVGDYFKHTFRDSCYLFLNGENAYLGITFKDRLVIDIMLKTYINTIYYVKATHKRIDKSKELWGILNEPW